jgi:hypothetical protein
MTDEIENDTKGPPKSDVIMQDLGFFGNIWVKSHHLPKSGDSNDGGHKHKFDHVTLVIRGKVLVEVESFLPKVFTAPKFIIIKKEHEHKFTALEDDTIYYCVFAMRDVDGDVTDLYDETNSPYWSGTFPDPRSVSSGIELAVFDKKTTQTSE